MKLMLSKYYFLIIVFLVCILRLITLDLQPLSLDELTTVNLLSTTKGPSFVLAWIRDYDTQLPLFYIIEYFVYHYIGESIFILRLPSLIFTFLGIFAAYKYSKNRFITLFLLTSFILTFHSQEVRPYGLLFLLSTLSFTLYNNKSKSIYFYLILVLLGLTHYFGLALSLIQLLLKAFQNKDQLKTKPGLILTSLVITLLALVSYYLGKDIYTDLLVIHPFREHISIKSLVSIAVYLLGGKVLSLTILLVTARYFSQTKDSIKYKNMYMASVILISMALFKSLLSTPVLEARYFIGLLLPLSFLVSQTLKSTLYRFIIIGLALYNTYINEAITKVPYRLATKKVSSYLNKDVDKDVYITSCDINLKYYVPNFKDCYYGKCDVSNYNQIAYISMNKDSYECSTLNSIKKSHQIIKTVDFKGLKVHHYKKK